MKAIYVEKSNKLFQFEIGVKILGLIYRSFEQVRNLVFVIEDTTRAVFCNGRICR